MIGEIVLKKNNKARKIEIATNDNTQEIAFIVHTINARRHIIKTSYKFLFDFLLVCEDKKKKNIGNQFI
ncbi:MAG: hypothetical protein GF317_04670 [Candidatus Lokiarchaeota archaeon]|nr:hypothetical protein [Candidatus Lokiarchaeota archaeon]